MNTAEELRERWEANKALKDEWRNITQGKLWQILVHMIREEAIAESRTAMIEADVMIARKHRELEAKLEILKRLEDAHLDQKKPEDTPDSLAEYEQKLREAYPLTPQD